MKRKIAVLLAFMMLFTSIFAVPGLAADDKGLDKGLEDAIKAAKSKISVPESYDKFNYDINTNGTKKVWQLSWSSSDTSYMGGNSLSIGIDEKGNIVNYNCYKPTIGWSRLPKISKKDALAKAQDFIKKVYPEILDKVKYLDISQNSQFEPGFNFTFVRYVNGIPYYNNTVNVNINGQNTEIENYNCNFDDELAFPSSDKIISLEEAKKIFRQNIKMNLIYRSTYENEKQTIYLAYIPEVDTVTSATYGIDAISGQKVAVINNSYIPGLYYNRAYDMMGGLGFSKSSEKEELKSGEIKAIEEVSKIMKKEDAEKIIRGIKELGLTDEFKVANASVSKDWGNSENFTWNLNFQKSRKEDMGFDAINVAINGKTGELIRFDTNISGMDNKEPVYDQKAVKEAVEKFLKEYLADKFSQTVYDDRNTMYLKYNPSSEKQRFYNFVYTRVVNGIKFEENSMNVSFDAATGKITSFYKNWSEVEFPSLNGVINGEQAYDKLFDKVGLELQYSAVVPVNKEGAIDPVKMKEMYYKYGGWMPQSGDFKPDIRLVFMPGTKIPAVFDAFTGEVLGNDGKPYKEVKPVEYSDIKGNYAEKHITTLAENGISLSGSEFRPDEKITQKDFFLLISKGMLSYDMSINGDTEKGIENLYKQLIAAGVVKEEEKNPTAYVTREDSVKFVLRALKYDKIAALKDIFKCPFKDVAKINPDLVGYVTIASGLKIINGYNGYFSPREDLTRSQAAVLIYNYVDNVKY